MGFESLTGSNSMASNTVIETRKLIKKNQEKWFELYKDFIKEGKVLVVGHGLGYTTELISKLNPDVSAIDIELEQDALLKDRVRVYDGDKIPFPDNSFDTVVVTYVLHHAADVSRLFDEVARTSKRNVVILEETYETFLQKIDLVYYCWYFNRKAGQAVDIHWNSYLTRKKIETLAQNHGMATSVYKSDPLRSYMTELFVFSKQSSNATHDL